MEPVTETVRFCQPNLLLLFILLFDNTRQSKWTGILTGIAAGFKVTPGLFIVFMLLTRRWMDALRAAIAFGVTVLIGAAFGIGQEWTYWTSTLFDTDRVGDVDRVSNGSISGVLSRIPALRAEQYSIFLAVLAVIVGLAVAVLWWKRDKVVAATIVGLTGVLIAPIAWIHHYVWLVPALWVLIAQATKAAKEKRIAVSLLVWLSAALIAVITLTGARRSWPKMFGSDIAEFATALYPLSAILAIALLLVVYFSAPSSRSETSSTDPIPSTWTNSPLSR